MRPYSQDLRQRIVDTVQRGEGTVRQIAERFLVSVSFVTRLLQLHRSRGSVEPQPHGGGNPAVLTPEDLERLREFIRERPDATLQECAAHLGIACGLVTIARALNKLGPPRKKKVPRAAEQDSPEVRGKRREFCEELAGIDPRRLVFVDECGADTSMTSPPSRRAQSSSAVVASASEVELLARIDGKSPVEYIKEEADKARVRRVALLGTAAQLALTIAFGYGLGRLLGFGWQEAAWFGALLSISSTAVGATPQKSAAHTARSSGWSVRAFIRSCSAE